MLAPSLLDKRTDDVKNAARERLRDLHRVFGHPKAAHRVMEVPLGGPLKFTARKHRYRIKGDVGAGWMDFVEDVSSRSPHSYKCRHYA